MLTICRIFNLTILNDLETTQRLITETFDTLIIANYECDQLNGMYQEFDSIGNVTTSGTYLNGEKQGHWYTYYGNGEVFKEWEYQIGQQIGKWYMWSPNKKGKMKREKISLESRKVPV